MPGKIEELSVIKTPGGVPVLVDVLPWSKAAAVAVDMSVGSRDEKADEHGVAHLLEHLLFKGTKGHSAKEMSQDIESAGGEMNGYTSKEITAYYVSTLEETLPTAQGLLAEMIQTPLLRDADIRTEKKVVTQEIRMSEDDPDTYSHDLLMKTVWKGNPMADPEAGYVKCVEEMRSDQIRDFFNGNYRPPNMAVVATGKVNVDQVVRWASESFDSLPKAKPRSERTAPAFRPSIELHPREGDQAYVAVGFPGVMASHPDRYVQGLVSGILAGGTSSRLYQKVREEKGLVYSIYSMTYAFSDTGMSSLFFSTSEDETVEVMRIIASELRSLKEDGLEKDELDRAKHWFKGMIVRRLESSVENRMFFLGEVYLQTGKALTGEQVLDRVGKVTEEDIARVGESLLKRENMGLALHANGKSSKGVIDQLSAVDF